MEDFLQTTWELLGSPEVRSMASWRHHGPITTLDHSLFVAYYSYRAARVLGLDAAAAARGGLLHDLYLYDSRDKSAHPGLQCFDHPKAAARNAARVTRLSDKERNIILSHMWPLGGALPRSREAWLVDLVDTLCASLELARICRPIRLRQRLGVLPLAA
ncbi:MAG: HDIG domain-containing protein [Lawsonibacter sp.]|nr:HDIG domain-containing protein [Lawsonibacter sp.]